MPRPIMAASTPLTGCWPSRLVRQQNANTISTKYSAGPNASAHRASSGASRTMPVTDTRAPTKADAADRESATLANPWRASGYPSSVVIMALASPGTLSRIDVMRPPYSAPTYTAASRINAVSGGRFMAKAMGISMATPLMGPRPGSTPTMVPINEPMAATSKLVSENATPKPIDRWSMMPLIADPPAGRQATPHPAPDQTAQRRTRP